MAHMDLVCEHTQNHSLSTSTVCEQAVSSFVNRDPRITYIANDKLIGNRDQIKFVERLNVRLCYVKLFS